MRQQPYPLQTDFENVPDLGSGVSREAGAETASIL